ncbi:MAG: hypothetical protein K8I00_02880 [Candidatus Omnitrophica bacterium]|nr:hypothetical protein [Candidatus Omnitrophota bacterium]
MYWIQFLLSSAVIVLAGVHLTKQADRLSEQMNLGKAWVGILLLGLITSLPEAITCIVAVGSLNADDLAVGNLLGSNNFNPMLIVLMDLVFRKQSITNEVNPRGSIKTSGVFVLLLTSIVILEILFPQLPHWGPLSFGGVILVATYLFGMQRIGMLSSREHLTDNLIPHPDNQKGSLARTWINVMISAVVVVAAAMLLANSADIIAEKTGLGRTFVGSIFLAIVTSLPEMVVTLSALKMGSLDLAVGNIFGSNMTNVFFVFLCSLFNPEGPVLNDVSPTHILTAVASMLLVIIAMIGIAKKGKRRFGPLGWDTWTMTGVFFSGSYLLYLLR